MSESGAGHRQRLRERFQSAGFQGFADHEKLELILTLCIPRKDVKQPAKDLLKRFGSLRQVLDATPGELQTVPGVGTVTPVALQVIREASSLYLQQSSEQHAEPVRSIQGIADIFRTRLAGLKHEVFEVMFLDSDLRPLPNAIERLEEGVVNQTPIIPRKILERCLKRGASGIVIVHNHPSGNLQPSSNDLRLTKSIQAATQAVDIRLLDHLIVGPDRSLSFKREKLL